MKVSVVIPVYNEASTIEKLVGRVIDAWTLDKVVTVVEAADGSTSLVKVRLTPV